MKKSIRILWVDDDIDSIQKYIHFLENCNYSIDRAISGEEAIDIFKNSKFDLVITEATLTDMDSFVMLYQMKLFNEDIPSIMLTKSDDEELMDKAISLRINEYFFKPINPNQLIMAIKRILFTSKIRSNRIGKKYTEFSANLNKMISSNPCINEWMEIYQKISKWDMLLDEVNEENLKQTLFLEKRHCNNCFSQFVEKEYHKWLSTNTRPTMSFDIVSQYIMPQLEEDKTVYFIVIDCLRYDQYLSIEPFIKKFFDIEFHMYCSILPTATPYSRNSLFSGLLPDDIAKRFPEYWTDSVDSDNSRNRNEHQLLDELLEDLGHTLNPSSKYIKIYNMEEGNYVLRKIDSYKHERMVVLVYNFLDLITHYRSKEQLLEELIPDEEAFRSITKHWFMNSALYQAIKLISKQDNAVIVLTTDHGSIKVNRAAQVLGDRSSTLTLRYKEGKNLTCNEKHCMFAKKPKDLGLPQRTIIDNYIFAKDDYYFIYPNAYHQYQKQFNGSFQHGGISMEEMLLPLAICKPRR
ncbi:MAG: PglZ domain-containing protein [Candidatus Cloacimonadales bacterium]|nr:PglZ domain-containing protein [Candidatus Cloacimonadota bacterium]MDX9977811.1 PglZ domain-containing protein [Candidatus Cloacimonadales bacterium]